MGAMFATTLYRPVAWQQGRWYQMRRDYGQSTLTFWLNWVDFRGGSLGEFLDVTDWDPPTWPTEV